MFIRFLDESASGGVSADDASGGSASVSSSGDVTGGGSSTPTPGLKVEGGASDGAGTGSTSGGSAAAVLHGGDGGSGQAAGAGAAAGQPAAEQDRYAAVLDWAREHGVDLSKYRDGRTAFEGMLHATKRVGQKTRLERIGEQVVGDWDSYQQWRAQQQANPGQVPGRTMPGQAAGPPQDSGLKMPKPLSVEVQQYLYRDEAGLVQVREDAPPAAVAAYQDWQQTRRAWAAKLTDDPESVFAEWEKRYESKFADRIEQTIAQREQAAEAERTTIRAKQEIAPWAYVLDGNGQPVRQYDDEGRSSHVMTEHGTRYLQAVQWLSSRGIQDPADLHVGALQMIGGPPRPGAPAPTTGDEAIAAQQIPPGGSKTPQRSPKPFQNTQRMTLKEIMRAKGELAATDE